MARKKKSDATDDATAEGDATTAKKEKKKKGNLVPAIIIAAGLVLGGKMMGGGGGAATTASASTETTTTTEAPGPVVKLDPITLNMADGRFLRVGLGFQLSSDHEGGGGGHGAPAAAPDTKDAAGEYAKALDIVIEVLGGARYDELVTPPGRDAAKAHLVERLRQAYDDAIEGVYFTEFVLQ